MRDEVRYVIITPVRDEEKYLEGTLRSVIRQTLKPVEWIIVNDGSSDRTGEVIEKYADAYSWIRGIHRENRGFRKAGGGVVEAFYEGYNVLNSRDWDFIVKLDGDLSFEKDYFERCLEKFQQQPNLGLGGGVVWNIVRTGLQMEKNPLFHVRGATKIYRKQCWEEIGDLIKAPGWDTLDEVKANMLGWKTQSFTDLRVLHHRPTGLAEGVWRGCVKNGVADYICGYHPLFMAAKCIKRLFDRPYGVWTVGLLYGFCKGYLKGVEQVHDEDLKKYLRREQLRKLMLRRSIWQ
jgi:glycosyltransferase involved in cell wall biosynthesis